MTSPRDVQSELHKLAEAHRRLPLVILGYAVDKTDPVELYGALIWIELNLHSLLTTTVVPDKNRPSQAALDDEINWVPQPAFEAEFARITGSACDTDEHKRLINWNFTGDDESFAQ